MASVLVVDDEVAITELLSETLQEEGHCVHICHNGIQALEFIVAQQPDLVLLDIQMPVMGGEQVLHDLRSHLQNELPVIVLSAHNHIEQFLEIGATDVLEKPFEIDALIDLINRHI